MSYNGWTNYETWCVHLWLSNEEGSYNEARDIVEGAYDADEPEDFYAAGQAIKAWVEDFAIPEGASLAQDLVSSSLHEVDWDAVAQAFAPEPVE